MQAVVKSFIFALLVCSFTSAQECSRKEITFANIQKTGLAAKYDSGDTVRVNCETGYVGFLKLTCDKGVWTKDAGRECKKRPCGHPGDTPNGDFKLIGDTEFVFGVTVEYTCRPGYVMASRVNIRHCRSQGWDNAVPVCEVVKCPAIQTSGDLIATGNTEEASFDDVIHFECTSRQMMLDGRENIHCTERGTWSGSVPKCIEIRCKLPTIPHAIINDAKEEYKENEQLKYSCEKKYRPRHGTPKCLRNGWSITPECEEINCLLGPPTPGTSTSPKGKNVFRVGESVEITCSDSHWLYGTREIKRNIICKESGEWEHSPVCEEITCDIPYGQHVDSPHYYFSRDRRLGVEKSYWCESGYRAGARTATCTEKGWLPNPLCTEIVCPEPTIENARLPENPQRPYKPGARIRYQCLHGSSTFEITCGWQGEWNNIRPCPATCPKPDMVITSGTIIEPQKVKNVYTKGYTVEYKCSEGFVFEKEGVARCTGREWTYPKCIPKPNVCASFRLENGLTHYFTKDTDSPRPSQGIYYSCDADYKTFEYTWWGETSCSPDALDYTPRCIHKNKCGRIPNIPHGKLAYDQHHQRDLINVYCDFGFKANTSFVTCKNGQWTTTKCEPLTGENYGAPPQVENAVITEYTQEPHQTIVKFECREHFELKGRQTVYYINKHWDKTPTCELSKSACGKPETKITRGIIKDSEEIMDYYTEGDTVEYKCFEGFMFEDETSARCTDGNWTYPKCIRDVCGPPPQVENADIKSSVKEPRKEVTYECHEHFELKGRRTIYCRSRGWDEAPTCELKHDQPGTTPSKTTGKDCGRPPQIEDAVQDFKDRYEHGEEAAYDCPAFYKKEGYLTCTQGRWTGSGKCWKPCTVDLKAMDERNIQLRHKYTEKIYSTHGDFIGFSCKSGYRPVEGSVSLRQSCNNGEIPLPVCE
ncbi:complement factor H-like isoform X2 [Colossoma macropomum]|uniref:complement factor H-like isoform X2 n=1 Tax=Colossoma macropomum TaxID=42526 RepID=UPI0018648D7D|nr:complement factor H-like isoform X2 [Colossoma macropomum]